MEDRTFVLWRTRTVAFIISKHFAKTLDFSDGNRQAFWKAHVDHTFDISPVTVRIVTLPGGDRACRPLKHAMTSKQSD